MSAGNSNQNTPLQHLQRQLVIPGAVLEPNSTVADGMQLWLMAVEDPQIKLDAAQIAGLWQALPYWAFAWAGGRALAAYLLKHPQQVAGQRVLDFGCGSGIVGIAAALAGASEVWVADLDSNALTAAAENAALNGVTVHAVDGRNWPEVDVLLAADVLYDISSSTDLRDLLLQAPQWLLAETQYVVPDFVDLQQLDHSVNATLPAIGDFDEAVDVGIYCRRR